jgi:hypothetical protein
VTGDTVNCTSHTLDKDFHRGAVIDLLPVAKSLAISAAECARSKIVTQLQADAGRPDSPSTAAADPAMATPTRAQRRHLRSAMVCWVMGANRGRAWLVRQMNLWLFRAAGAHPANLEP